MKKALERYVGLLIDRIGELSIENELLKQMLRSADIQEVRKNWERHLEIALASPAAHQKRADFALKRDGVLTNLDREEAVEAMLKLPTKGLPN
jgi:hypothetical protein